jgi:carboxyl-terminal processing protease
MPLRNITILLLTALISIVCRVESGRNRYSSALSEAIDTISHFYVEEVEPRDLFEGGIEGMLGGLDPYSSFIRPSEYQQFADEIKQEFGGIGIEVGVRDERLTVISPLPGTPAYEAGLMAGDIILAISDQDTEGFTMEDAVKLIKGKPGTSVKLSVLHAGESDPFEVVVDRAIISIDSVRGDRRKQNGDWIFTLESHPRIGYLRLSTFAENSADEVRRTVESLNKNVDGLIIDLRLNPGGLLDVGIATCDLFLEKGQTIVTIRQRGGVLQNTFVSENDPVCDPNLPIVVLVDQGSASASEIFAACLQDHGRATVVGQRTYGKGTVQNVIEMEGGKSAMRLTTATYWRPSGKNIHRHKNDDESAQWGVRPKPEDMIEIEMERYQAIFKQRLERDVLQPGEAGDNNSIDDPFIERAIELLEGTAQDEIPRAAA